MSQISTIRIFTKKLVKEHFIVLDLLTDSFQSFDVSQVIIFIDHMMNMKKQGKNWRNSVEACFKVFDEYYNKNQGLQKYLKQVFFLHLISQSIRKQSIQEIPMEALREILMGRLQYLQKLAKNQNNKDLNANHSDNSTKKRSISKEALQWVRNKISKSKDKTQQNQKEQKQQKLQIKKLRTPHEINLGNSDDNGDDNHLKIITNKSNNSNKRQVSPFPDRKHLETQISSLDKLIYKKIYEPLVLYILKILSTQILFSPSEVPIDRDQKVWLLINTILKLLQATTNFSQIIRYSEKQYKPLVICLVHILHYDIRTFYAQLAYEMQLMKNEIDSVIVVLNMKQQRKQLMHNKFTNSIVNQLKITEFKEIIDQISVINEGLSYIYFNKYIYQKLAEQNLKPPQLIATVGTDLDIIFEIHRRTSSSKSKNKQKSLKNCSKGKENRNSKKLKVYDPTCKKRDSLKIVKKADKGIQSLQSSTCNCSVGSVLEPANRIENSNQWKK